MHVNQEKHFYSIYDEQIYILWYWETFFSYSVISYQEKSMVWNFVFRIKIVIGKFNYIVYIFFIVLVESHCLNSFEVEKGRTSLIL